MIAPGVQAAAPYQLGLLSSGGVDALGAVAASALAAIGTFLLYDGLTRQGRSPSRQPHGSPESQAPPRFGRHTVREWFAQAGLADVDLRAFAGVLVIIALAAAVLSYGLFGGAVPAALSATLSVAGVLAAHRTRRRRRIEEARRAWPRMIEEIRIQTGGMGRAVPQALLEVGKRGPAEMRAAFEAAEREWLVSTDFQRTVTTLKERLADSAADSVCETLLVAHEVGGSGIDRRLEALAQDRVIELEGRKDALAKQAGARFARRFVLLVPLGMAFAGLSIGSGRAAYETPAGQLAVAAAALAVAGCWVWAGRLMRLPEQERVFR